VDAALAAGGRDNVTVAIVDVVSAPPIVAPPDLGEA
jgi:serine/threonine protein phosphatase PrpC